MTTVGLADHCRVSCLSGQNVVVSFFIIVQLQTGPCVLCSFVVKLHRFVYYPGHRPMSANKIIADSYFLLYLFISQGMETRHPSRPWLVFSLSSGSYLAS